MITQTYNIDLIPSGVPTIVHVSQYDSASRTIAMSIYDGGVAYDLTDKTVTVRGTKQDNTGFEYPCTIDGNVASFVLNVQMTIFSGDVPCEIRIAENGFVIGTHNFVLRVERTPLDSSIVISDTELPLIEGAEQNAIRAEQAADEAEALLSTVVKSVNSVTPDAQGNVDVVALPTGGTAGQYLRKESSADGDADWENIDASTIAYDNTSSGLTATDVQAAIDETSLLGGRYFYNRTVTTWESDSTYADYPYKGTISITGVTDADGVEVTFSNADATSGNYSPICATFNGGVYIWSKTQNASIVIPTICIYGRSNEDLSGEFPYLSLEGGTVRGDIEVTGNLTANGTDLTTTSVRNLYIGDYMAQVVVCGKVCQLSLINGTSTTAFSVGSVIGQLPEGLRPHSQVQFLDLYNKTYRLTINQDGELVATQTAIPSGTILRGSVVYIRP